MQQVAAFAVGQLARQHGHAGALAFLDLLARTLARLGLLDDELGQLLAELDVLVQPQLQRGLYVGGHQPQRIARVEPLLDLALELRVQHLRAEHETGPREHVLGHQLDALGQQRVQLDESLDRAEEAVLQAGLVGAASDRRDQVDVTLAHRRTVFGEGDAPGRALAFGEVLGLAAVRVVFAFEQRNHRVGVQALREVIPQPALVQPTLDFAGLLDRQRDLGSWHQHGLAAQQVREFGAREVGTLEVGRVGPGAHRGAALAVARRLLAQHQRLDHVAAREGQARHLSFAVDRDLQGRPCRRRSSACCRRSSPRGRSRTSRGTRGRRARIPRRCRWILRPARPRSPSGRVCCARSCRFLKTATGFPQNRRGPVRGRLVGRGCGWPARAASPASRSWSRRIPHCRSATGRSRRCRPSRSRPWIP